MRRLLIGVLASLVLTAPAQAQLPTLSKSAAHNAAIKWAKQHGTTRADPMGCERYGPRRMRCTLREDGTWDEYTTTNVWCVYIVKRQRDGIHVRFYDYVWVP